MFARAGYHGDFFFVAQWFPKIGVWEKAGDRYATVGGWNCHQYHANSESEESWLDEGLNTYSTSKILDRVYGP